VFGELWLGLRVLVAHRCRAVDRAVCGSALRRGPDCLRRVVLELRGPCRRYSLPTWGWVCRSADRNCRAILRGFVDAAHFDVGRNRMEDVLRRDDVSGMR